MNTDKSATTKPSLLKRIFFAPSVQDDSGAWKWQGLLAGWLPAFCLVALVFYFSFHQLAYRWNWPSVYKYRWNLLSGWGVTIGISFVCLLLSTVLGLVFALVRRSPLLPLRNFGHLYVALVRGAPGLGQSLGGCEGGADAWRGDNREGAGVLIRSCFSCADSSDGMRACLQS